MNCHLGWSKRGINWNVFNTPVYYGLVCWGFMGQKLRKKVIESLTLSDTLFTGAVEKQILFIFILEKNRVFKVSSRVTDDVVAQEVATEKHCIYRETERALSHHWKTFFQASWASWGPARVTCKTSPSTVLGSTTPENLSLMLLQFRQHQMIHPGWQNASEGHPHCPAAAAAWQTELWAGAVAGRQSLVTAAEPRAGLGSALLLWAGWGVVPPPCLTSQRALPPTTACALQ